MFKQSLAVVISMAALAGCASTTLPNPVDYATYRNEPLVKQVEEGMTKEQVLTIGGTPSTTVQRRAHPGTCNNYVLNREAISSRTTSPSTTMAASTAKAS